MLAKAVVLARGPVGIDAVHLPHGSGFAELVNIGHEVLVAVGREIFDHAEILRSTCGEIERQLLLAVFEHVVEHAAPPVLRAVALIGRPVFERVALVGRGVVPAEAAAFEDRVQRVDEHHPASYIET